MNGPPAPDAPRRGFWRSPYDFWARPVRAEPLALFRILIGVTILLSLLTSLGPRLSRDLGPDGLYPVASVDDWINRSWRFSLLCGPANLPLLSDTLPPDAVALRDWCDDPVHAAGIFGVLVAAVVCLTLGFCTRTATVVAWALFVSFNERFIYLMNGGDSMMRCALFYLMFAPSGAVWSIDHLLRVRVRPAAAADPVLVPAWPVRLMQIQLALVYFFTGLSKVALYKDGWDWINGEAVYWVLNDYTLTRWPYCWLPVPMWICRVLSRATLVFELGFPFFVVFARPYRIALGVGRFRVAFTFPALRPWLLLAGLAFHLGILVHTEVGWFSPATAAWYALFLSGEGVRNFVSLKWLRRRRLATAATTKSGPP